MIFFRALNYLKFLVFSKSNGHGIHSPFIFNLVSVVLRNKINPDIVFKAERIRNKLISDNRIIEVRDLGSGSLKMKSNLRKVSDIARNSAVTRKYGFILSNLAAEFGRSSIIEFGTSFGISTMYLAGGAPESKVYSMEGCQSISAIAAENFKSENFTNIIQMTGSFDELLPEIKKIVHKPGLIFIDGNHRKVPVMNYFSEMVEISDSNTVIVIDDIHNSGEMEEAWEDIMKNERVTATVDLYRMGIVFLKEEITRTDYKIRLRKLTM